MWCIGFPAREWLWCARKLEVLPLWFSSKHGDIFAPSLDKVFPGHEHMTVIL